MPALTLNHILQLLLGLGLLNVWAVRRDRGTAYRGGGATSLREEFDAYGLPSAAFYLVGLLKVLAGVILLTGLVWSVPVKLAAVVVAVLMVGAIIMHMKIKDPIRKSVPAVVMLALSVALSLRM